MNMILDLIPDIVFHHQYFLWFLPIVAVLIPGTYIAKHRIAKRKLSLKWFAMHLPGSFLPSGSYYAKKAFVLSIVLAGLIIASADPERKTIVTEDIYNVRMAFLFDSSRSMAYASDTPPTRLAVAKELVKSFVLRLKSDSTLKGNYALALIPFSGSSIPLFTGFTAELDVFFEMLEQIDEYTITSPGTSLLAALRGYSELLKKFPVSENGAVDLVFLVSDGGKEESIFQNQEKIIQIINTLPDNVVINTIGIGSKEIDLSCAERARQTAQMSQNSAENIDEVIKRRCEHTIPVPLLRRGSNNAVEGYVRLRDNDPRSPVLTSELDEAILSFIAHADDRGGEYMFFEDSEVMIQKMRALILKNRVVIGTKKFEQYEPASAFFLVPAFLFFCLFFLNGWAVFVAFVRYIKSRVFKPASH